MQCGRLTDWNNWLMSRSKLIYQLIGSNTWFGRWYVLSSIHPTSFKSNFSIHPSFLTDGRHEVTDWLLDRNWLTETLSLINGSFFHPSIRKASQLAIDPPKTHSPIHSFFTHSSRPPTCTYWFLFMHVVIIIFYTLYFYSFLSKKFFIQVTYY